MSFQLKSLTLAAVFSLSSAAALALPPRGVNPAANGQEVLQQCRSQCTAAVGSVSACNFRCAQALHPAYNFPIPPTPSDATNCSLSKGGTWAWWIACTADLSVLSDGVNDVISKLTQVSSTAVGAITSVASGVTDPCGFVKDNLLKNLAAEGCS